MFKRAEPIQFTTARITTISKPRLCNPGQFRTADLNFHSSSYDWLVVTGSDYARFKGTGAINGEGEYKFMIWAGDGTDENGSDTFRIRIWAEDEATGVETVVYDNGFDQIIGGGSIVIHAK